VLGVWAAYKLHYWVERKCKLDDAVGAVAIHGYCGSIGLIAAGFILWGYPSSTTDGYAHINPVGQLIGAVIIFFGLGFFPCYLLAGWFKRCGLLRIPPEVELAGLDHTIILNEMKDRSELEDAERRTDPAKQSL
jgi:ammonium transporter, Amt family